MPTDRFYRLPEEKKQAIRKAAVKEFARVPFEKASINQLIRNADISRGSFYTYFKDKQDVVEFLFEDAHMQMKQICREELACNGGDFFAMLNRMFEHFVEKLHDTKEMMEIAKNVFCYEDNTKILGMKGWPEPALIGQENGSADWLYDQVNKSRLRFVGKDAFMALLTLGMSSMIYALKQYYKHPEQLEQVRNLFHKSLLLLQQGAYRNEDELMEGRQS